jgi:hypothetical protein
MHFRSKLFVMTMVGTSIFTSNSLAATVTYTLDLSVDDQWELRATASAGDNFGLVFYDVPLTGNALTVDNRSPLTTNLANFAPAGFNLLRIPAPPDGGPGVNPEIRGSQDAVSGPLINHVRGFGQENSNWAAEGITPLGSADPTNDGVWLHDLVLARGTYERSLGTMGFNLGSPNLVANVWAAETGRSAPAAQVLTQVIPFVDPNTPPTVIDAIVGPPYNANEPGEPQTLQHQMTANDLETPLCAGCTWSPGSPSLISYTPAYGGTGPDAQTPLIAPTLSSSGLFEWVSEGSRRGIYQWGVTVTDPGGLSDDGTITVHVTHVPEPTTLALVGLVIGLFGCVRRGR